MWSSSAEPINARPPSVTRLGCGETGLSGTSSTKWSSLTKALLMDAIWVFAGRLASPPPDLGPARLRRGGSRRCAKLRLPHGQPVARLNLLLQQPPDFGPILRAREALELMGACQIITDRPGHGFSRSCWPESNEGMPGRFRVAPPAPIRRGEGICDPGARAHAPPSQFSFGACYGEPASTPDPVRGRLSPEHALADE